MQTIQQKTIKTKQMTEFTLPHFGQINLGSLKEYYELDVEFKDDEIQIDLNFTDKTIDIETMEVVKDFIENIDMFDKKNKINIDKDYNDEEGETVKTYLEQHLEEIDKSELSSLINFEDENVEPQKQLLNNLKLVRVGLYPHDDNFAIFDYTIGRELTNYLVVVNVNKDGDFDYMTMES